MYHYLPNRRQLLSAVSSAAIIAGLSPGNAGTMLLLGAGKSGGLPGVGPIPIPTAVLASSRLQLPNLATASNGTNTTSNSRIAMYNETGATITKLKVFWVNWNSVASGSNEVDGTSTITVTASVEFPAGTVNQCLFSAATSATIAPAGLALNCDEVTLSTPITPGSIFWVNTFVSVVGGQKWPIVIQTPLYQTANMNEGCNVGVGLTDQTLTPATITGNNSAYAPSAVLATGFTGTSVKFGIIGLGDSVIAGATDVQDPQTLGHGNIGFLGKACASKCAYVDMAVTGSKAQSQIGVNFTKRLDLLNRLGPLIICANWGSNDMAGGRTFAQVSADNANIFAQIAALGGVKRIVGLPIIPRTNDTFAGATVTSVSTTANVQIPSTANLRTGQKIVMAGWNVAAYNGTFNITVIDSQNFSYTFAGGTSPTTGGTVSDRWESTVWQVPVTSQFNAGNASDRAKWNAAMRNGQLPNVLDIIEISDPVETFRNSSFWTNGTLLTTSSHVPNFGSGTVSSGINATAFNSNATTLYTNYWIGGQILFLTGANAGQIRTVSSNTTAGQYVLSVALSNTPSAADTFLLFPNTVGLTSDGLHPFTEVAGINASPATSGQSGVYLIRDVAISKIAAWLLL